MKILINEDQLSDIINEGSIRLTYNERQQVEEMLPKIIEVIKGKDLGENDGSIANFNNFKKIGLINGISADGSTLQTTIYVGNNPNNYGSAYFYRGVGIKLTDNVVVIQQREFAEFFKGILKYKHKLNKKILGNENWGIEALRGALVHELIHSKDPKQNQKLTKIERTSTDREYYSSKAEFVTLTGQFFEAIISSIDKSFELGKTKEQILDALDNILMVYSGKERIFNQNAKDFIQGSKNRTIFQDIINEPMNFLNIRIKNKKGEKVGLIYHMAIDRYDRALMNIKKYAPKKYIKFLRELYKVINEAKDKVEKKYKLVTVKGNNMRDLEIKFENFYKNIYINPNSFEFNPNTYSISFKPGLVKAKSLLLMYEYFCEPNPYHLCPIEYRAKMFKNDNNLTILKQDLNTPSLKWVIAMKN